MNRWKVTLRCKDCGHKWTRVLKSDGDEPPDENPPCPICLAVQKRIGLDLSRQKAPATVGSNQAKAVDETAKIVMEDFGMTDLCSDVREQETAAPKLPPAQQAMVDGFWGGKNARTGGLKLNTDKIARQAMAGAFAPQRTQTNVPLQSLHENKVKPTIRIIADTSAPQRRR